MHVLPDGSLLLGGGLYRPKAAVCSEGQYSPNGDVDCNLCPPGWTSKEAAAWCSWPELSLFLGPHLARTCVLWMVAAGLLWAMARSAWTCWGARAAHVRLPATAMIYRQWPKKTRKPKIKIPIFDSRGARNETLFPAPFQCIAFCSEARFSQSGLRSSMLSRACAGVGGVDEDEFDSHGAALAPGAVAIGPQLCASARGAT